MMKLIAFRIKNFRSIVDTGWQKLSPDSITCLIGQNESGKTSILEGLRVFYTGVITEDVLRSDLALPEVSCRFSIPRGWLIDITDNPGTELKELLSGLDHLELKRDWIADLSSEIRVGGEISEYLDSLEDAWNLYLDNVIGKLKEEMNAITEMEDDLSKLQEEERELRMKLEDVDAGKKPFWVFRKRHPENGDSQKISSPGMKSRLNEVKKASEKITSGLESKREIRTAGEKWQRLQDNYTRLNKHLEELSVKLEERHQELTLLMRPVNDETDHEWKGILDDFKKTREECEMLNSELSRHTAMSGYIIEGHSGEEAEKEVSRIIQSYKSKYNSYILGGKYFEYCPVFELFEDFGSLLPNRIDMEDIITGNEKVEGYKAARNFLSLAQLDYSFFQQPSSRILKQKIENLNHTLTCNFHDFWQQSVGRNNKIHIQFELDHYSATYSDKAGKPYLEFWIKDEGERLYPKQRSRGVRWFLSFYMELKASANLTSRQKVLLVDEPGVSLHARAQEDVLKVFEDIKDKIQIIYTTHSPHLVEVSKLHRILAVQRDDLDSMRSTTHIIDPLRLSAASPDTLTPLQNIMGNPVSGAIFSPGKIHLVVNDTGSFYMLKAIFILMKIKEEISVIPSTGVSSIPLLCNILMGWSMRFKVLLFNNDNENRIAEVLRSTIFKTESDEEELIINMSESFCDSEDLLSTLDFKNHILHSREGITVKNSAYIKEKELSRNYILSMFLADVKGGKIKISDFDEETLENFRFITDRVKQLK